MAEIFPRYAPGVEELLHELCERRAEKRVYVSNFPRFGLSGAKLLLLCFDAPKALPYLFKIASRSQAEEEYAAVLIMQNFCNDCRLAQPQLFESGEWCGLLYPHLATDKLEEAEKPSALREVLFVSEDRFSTEKLANAVREAFGKLSTAHEQLTWQIHSIQDIYGSYFRDDRSIQRLKNVFGVHADSEEFEFLGTTIVNPILLRKQIPDRVDLPVARVHGDLHPDNVILDRHGLPHLVDFAWARLCRDVLVDFVLLENSLRFRDFPTNANLDEQLAVDQVMMLDDPMRGIAEIRFSHEKTKRAYHRLANVVSAIRARARDLLKDRFTMDRYLFAQFIVLYGLLRYEEYEPYPAIRFLGMTAKRLKTTGWDFLR